MRSSRRSRLAAVSVFILIASVVVGGMAWATRSSFQLARKQVTEDYERLVRRAVGLMDNHISGILAREGSRDHTHYLRIHSLSPGNVVAVYTPRGEELDAASVVLRSPLAGSELPEEWMDLFFQWDPSGGPEALTSPQIDAEHAMWKLDQFHGFPAAERRAKMTFEWLQQVLPQIDLHDRVAEVCRAEVYDTAFDDTPCRCPGICRCRPDGGESSAPDIEGTPAMGEGSTSTLAVGDRRVRAPGDNEEFQRRKRSLRDAQGGYLPPEECVDVRHVHDVLETARVPLDERISHFAGEVSLTVDPFTAFWLGEGPDGNRKLAFVRECHLGDVVFYQGFVGDWSRLKPTLLRVIQHYFPGADLVAVSDDDDLEGQDIEARMINLPLRLSAAGVPRGASTVAWERVRSPVLIMWLTAAAVLIVAGWGLRNLVALTERRMQFAYAVTHELRTPLTTFRLYADMLSAGLVPESSKKEYLETLNRESQRLTSLVESVLEYARLENQRVQLKPTETDGSALLGSVSEAFQKLCDDYGVRGVAENALHNGRRLLTDVDVVRRIAGVLLNNACRHARGRNGATVFVRLCDGENGVVHLDVIDSGPGIERADARTIFKPFRRGRRADANAQGGIGLGLALARSWAELLGGRLELTARHHLDYGGAHFRLTIPDRVET